MASSFDADGDGFTMAVGGSRAGALLEIGAVQSDDGLIIIVHAMPARPRYLQR